VSLQVGQAFNPFGLFNGVFVPECLSRCCWLSGGAKLAWGRLARYAGRDGRCYPTLKTLGQEIGVGERQAQKYIAELERHKLIRRISTDTHRSLTVLRGRRAYLQNREIAHRLSSIHRPRSRLGTAFLLQSPGILIRTSTGRNVSERKARTIATAAAESARRGISRREDGLRWRPRPRARLLPADLGSAGQVSDVTGR
jgi:hypothetical protein